MKSKDQKGERNGDLFVGVFLVIIIEIRVFNEIDESGGKELKLIKFFNLGVGILLIVFWVIICSFDGEKELVVL